MSEKATPPLKKGQTIKDERKMFRSEETTPGYEKGGPVRDKDTMVGADGNTYRRGPPIPTSGNTQKRMWSKVTPKKEEPKEESEEESKEEPKEEETPVIKKRTLEEARQTWPQAYFDLPENWETMSDEEWQAALEALKGKKSKYISDSYSLFNGYDEGGEVKDIDADSIIDAFLEENPDLVDTPPEEWPEEAIKLLQDVINTGNVDNPNGVLPDEENAKGEPQTEGADNFDIMALADLVNAGDKEGAWDMLCNMFGAAPASEAPEENKAPKEKEEKPKEDKEPEKEENTLSRLTASDKRVKKPANRLASFIGKMDW